MRLSRRNFLSYLLPILLAYSAVAQQKSQPADNTPAYRNPKLAIEDRVADLLSRMTLEEKIGQIAPCRGQTAHVIDPTGTFTDESASAILYRCCDPDIEFPP